MHTLWTAHCPVFSRAGGQSDLLFSGDDVQPDGNAPIAAALSAGPYYEPGAGFARLFFNRSSASPLHRSGQRAYMLCLKNWSGSVTDPGLGVY